MIELQHRSEPVVLSRYRTQNPRSAWSDPAFEPVRQTVRRRLNSEQGGLCIYCEIRLDEDKGHVEHIKPRSARPDLTFAYDNLGHSCDGPEHCGHYKKDRGIPIEPRIYCNRFFALSEIDGRLGPASGLTPGQTQQATDTCNVLGLNAAALARQRKNYADTIRALSNQADIDGFIAIAPFRWSLRGLLNL